MKKTISIHIQGFPFLIEEDAFSTLQNYMNRLKSALNNQEGTQEIIVDIELRIAELFTQKLSQSKQVIDEGDLSDVLNTLGDPSDYAEEDSTSKAPEDDIKEPFYQQDLSDRRLFRDIENSYIGGVCAGLGSYFKIDVTIIRIIWALFFFIGGMGLLLYILLWIILPKPASAIDRLKMKGKPINVDTVKEEVERAANKVSEKGKQFADNLKNDETIRYGANKIGRLFKIIVGCFLIFIGLSSAVSLIFVAIGAEVGSITTDGIGGTSIYELSQLFFNNSLETTRAWIGFYLCSISFVTFCLLAGFVLIFELKNKWYRYTNFALVFIGIAGMIMGSISFVGAAKDYTIEGEIEKEIASINADSLMINTITHDQLLNSEYTIKNDPTFNFFIDGDKVYDYGIPIKYHLSKDSLFHVVIQKEAHANSQQKAVKRAEAIQYEYTVQENNINLSTYFYYAKKQRLRGQSVRVLIYVPRDKKIYVNNELQNIFERKESNLTYVDDETNINIHINDERLDVSGKIRSNGTYSHYD